MTTIAYNHKDREISVDSRVVKNHVVMSEEYSKWVEIDGGIIFFTGSVSDIDQFIDNMGDVGFKPSFNIDLTGIMVRDGTVYECAFDDSDGYFQLEIKYNAGWGSGGLLACSSMDFGLNSEEAVKYAIKKDVFSGGAVNTYSVKNGKFISAS